MGVSFIGIGASLGGVAAISRLFSNLPDNFQIPVAAVIHRGANDFDYLLNTLSKSTSIKISEPFDKMAISPNSITLAPSGYHLLVDGNHFALSADAPVNYARPSIDVLFESIADRYGKTALGVLLTGGGIDGVSGLLKIKTNDGVTFVQDPDNALDPSLPNAALKANAETFVDTIENISMRLLSLCETCNEQ